METNLAALLRLATVVVIEAHDEWQETRRYVSEVSMNELRVFVAAIEWTVESLTPQLESA